MQINFVKTRPDAVIPTRGSAGAAAFDLTAVSLKRAADLMICGAAGMCPNYTSTPDWWKLRRLSDKWVTGMMGMCPGCDEEGDRIYQELVA